MARSKNKQKIKRHRRDVRFKKRKERRRLRAAEASS